MGKLQLAIRELMQAKQFLSLIKKNIKVDLNKVKLLEKLIEEKTEYVKRLLNNGEDPNEGRYETLLEKTARNRDTEIMQLLYKYGADPKKALEWAKFRVVQNKNEETYINIVNTLSSSPPPSLVDRMIAALSEKNNCIKILSRLKKQEANFNEKDMDGFTLLHRLLGGFPYYFPESFEKASQLLDYLLVEGADPKIGDNYGRNALHYLVTGFLSKPRHVEEKMNQGPYPKTFYEQIICRLLRHNFNIINAEDDNHKTALGLATEIRCKKAELALLKAEAALEDSEIVLKNIEKEMQAKNRVNQKRGGVSNLTEKKVSGEEVLKFSVNSLNPAP